MQQGTIDHYLFFCQSCNRWRHFHSLHTKKPQNRYRLSKQPLVRGKALGTYAPILSKKLNVLDTKLFIISGKELHFPEI